MGKGLVADAPEISVVVPAFNEERRLPNAISQLTAYLAATPLVAEVLIVENGSVDRTPEIGNEAAAKDGRFKSLHVRDRGKGRAVREGMLAARGQVVVFCDADFSMPVEGISDLNAAVLDGADIAIASREAPGAHRIGEPWRRHLQGRVFNWLVRIFALPGLQDTQCGFKAFRRDVAQDLFRRQMLDGWAFDVEVLFLARRRGYRIHEVPITWWYDASSRVSPVRDTIAMLRELVTIRWNAMLGKYGQ
jgi:glycosyltransferase involved in cell wall biosynthesis